MVNDTEQYYVYIVTLVDEIVYVGKGQGRRFNHVLSGKSHNKYINEAYYRSTLLGEPMMEVEIGQWFSSSEDALKHEAGLIREHRPVFNVAGNGDVRVPKKKSKRQNPLPLKKETKLTPPLKPHFWPKGFTDIPEGYEEFKDYMKDRYEEYLVLSQAENPHPLKWYIYGKLISDAWINYYTMLEDYFNELTEVYEDRRKGNTGRPRKSFRGIFDMSESQRNAFYKWQRKVVGFPLDIENEDHIKLVKEWLDSRDW